MGIIMQKPLVRVFVLILASVACVGFAHAFTFRSSEGHFTAEFAEEPKLKEISGKNHEGAPFTQYIWQAHKDGTVFTVSMTISTKQLKFNYDQGVTGFVQAINGKLIRQQKLQIKRTEGREMIVEAAGVIFRVRFVFVDQRLYQISCGGPPGSEKSAAAEAFLNSVQLGK